MDRGVKRLNASFQERRRAAALESQKTARKQATDRARKLALNAGGSQDGAQEIQDDGVLQDSGASSASPEIDMRSRRSSSGAGGSRRSPGNGAHLRQQYAAQLMQPEWLVEVPADLATEWYALPRPEGQRCLIIAARGATSARLRSGALLERFASRLPGGGPGQRSTEDNFSILDCVYHEADQTYYVLDLMCWSGYSLYDCSAEFRLFWVQSKLEESGATVAHPISFSTQQNVQQGQAQGQQMQQQGQLGQQAQQQQQTRRFVPLPAYRCTAGGLQMAHSQPVSFQRDGLLLLHKEAQYSLGGTPLALLWKDAGSSRYFIDTDAAGVPLSQQQVVLEFRMDCTVATQDEVPVVLGRMPDSFVQQMGDRLRPGKLLKFGIGPGGIAFKDGQPVGADLHFAGPANQRRGRADSITKILFQHLARTQPITLAHLQAAAAASEAAAAAAAAAAGGAGGIAAGGIGGGGGGGGDKMGSGDSNSMMAGGGGSMSVQSEAAGGSAVAMEAGETDGIEVDS